VDGGRAGLIVVVAGVEHLQIDMLVHQSADRVFQCARHNLVLERNREHDQLIFIASFVFCHSSPSIQDDAISREFYPTYSTVSTALR